MNGIAKLESRARAANSLLCIGLDPEPGKLPRRFLGAEHPQFEFNRFIIDATHKAATAYKPNLAFYEARGAAGIVDLELTMEYLRERYPDVFVIGDAKRSEIGNTSRMYAAAMYDHFGFDACTLNPYLGEEALAPFLEREDKVSIILCRTSNPGAREFQDLESNGVPLWQTVAMRVRDHWNRRGNCMLVVGATYPEEIRAIRKLAPGLPFLIPAVGAQGGSVQAAVEAGQDDRGLGMLISASRSVIFADDPGAAAGALKEEINAFRHAQDE